jgi:hypothetical protein
MEPAMAEGRRVNLCGLETYRYPHTVLCNEAAEQSRSPVRSRFG